VTGLRGHLVALLASIALAGALAAVLHGTLRGPALPPGDGDSALERAAGSLLGFARERGLAPDPGQPAAFVDDALPGLVSSFRARRFVFAARPTADALQHDVYLLRARVEPNGAVPATPDLYDLTESPDGDERALVVQGTRVAFATQVQGAFTGVTVLDLAGEAPDPAAPASARLARALGNLLRCGDMAGFEVRRFEMDTSTLDLRLSWEGDDLVVARQDNDGWSRAHLDPARGTVDVAWLHAVEVPRATPSLLSWAVDTARGISWIGPERIYALEQAWFRLADFGQGLANRLWRNMDDADELRALEASVVQDTPASEEEPPPPPPATDVYPLDRPPPDIAPRVQPALTHEGHWRPYHFQARPPGAPPTFWRTTLRVDPERPDAITELVLMDPRQVVVKMVAGTEHPRSTTGAVGTGMVPAPERARTLAAFNGGFQAVHGSYGMAVDRRVFLPPKAQIATYALYDDDRPAFGTWPAGRGGLPAGMRSMRQNLPPLVEGGKYNPLKARTWGFTVHGTDPIYTWRSGLGVTKDGWIIFGACTRCSAETLADAFLAADTTYALHLDMNISNIGFEWWKPGEGGRIETERLLRSMWKANESRYVDPHNRDFFYVVRRAAFPERLEAAESAFGATLEAVALPGAGDVWPPRAARAHVTVDGHELALAWLAPQVTAALATGDEKDACELHVHRAVLGERLPATGIDDPDPALPTLRVTPEGALRLDPPGPAAGGFFQQLPPLVLEGRPVAGLSDAAGRGDHWLIGADAEGGLLLLGGPASPAALARTAVALGVVTAADPAPRGGGPRLTCAGTDLVDVGPPARDHRIRFTAAPAAPQGLAFVWGAAPPDHPPP
jgi:hypothetical protein